MSKPKLNIKEETSTKKTRSPPKKTKVEQSVPKKKKLKTDADKAAEKAQHLRFGKAIETPPVELIQFVDSEIHKEQSDLFTTSISEVCFYTDDIDSVYKTLIENHVECLSEPQYFDFRANGFGESRAFYFRDPDGIILEMMQTL